MTKIHIYNFQNYSKVFAKSLKLILSLSFNKFHKKIHLWLIYFGKKYFKHLLALSYTKFFGGPM